MKRAADTHRLTNVLMSGGIVASQKISEGPMAKVLVAGGLHEEEEMGNLRQRFAAALDKNVVLRGHTLLGGCRTGLDKVVAEAAAEAAAKKGVDPRKVIRSWVTLSTKPSHSCGELVRSQLTNWSEIPRGFVFPEPVQDADAVIIIGGWDGTHHAASWARLAGKALLPVATFGGAAAEIYKDELTVSDRRHSVSMASEDYQVLNRILPDEGDATVDAYALEVLKLAERTILSSDVFVVMSFEDKPHLRDAYNTFHRVCKEKNFSAEKVDHHLDNRERIVPAIFSRIKRSAFVIAEVSGAKPNVYYELGYARALGKHVIQTAYEGTALPFDVFDVPTHFWESQDTLERKLKLAIDQLINSPGLYA
jgi:hypothetical protein